MKGEAAVGDDRAVSGEMVKEGAILRLIYFFFNIAMPLYFMFINLYFQRLGMTGRQIGLLNSIYYSMNFLFQPVWGYISDTLRARKPVLMLLALISAGTMLIFRTAESYSRLLGIVALLGTSFNAVMPILDASVLNYVRRSGVGYGSIRLWGSVGFVAAGFLIGRLITAFGLRAIFPAGAAVLLLLFAAAWQLPREPRQLQPIRIPPGAASEASRVRQTALLLARPQFAVFLATAFLIQMSMSMGFAFLNIYMSQIGASDAFIGLSWSVSGLSEIAAFALLSYFLDRFGARAVILIAYSAMALRWFFYSLVRVPLFFLPVQLMQGITVGFFFAGGVSFVQEEASEELKTTGQTIFGAVNMGLGPIAGMALGGYLADTCGLPNLFYFCSLTALGTALFFGVFGGLEKARARVRFAEERESGEKAG